VTANDELARRLSAEADAAMTLRRALLCASVALATTASIPAARTALQAWNGPASVRDSALKVLDELTSATTEEVTASRSPGVA
jgi:hypothetical protein